MMLADQNPYTAPQAEFLLAEKIKPALRWEFVDYGFRVGVLISLASLLILAACAILISDAWLLTMILFAMYGIPLAVFACWLLGVFATGVDRLLQAVGWRIPPQAIRPERNTEELFT